MTLPIKNQGSLVVAPIRPYTSQDVYPVAYASEIRGGFHQVETRIDRDNIPAERRTIGMFCYVLSMDKVFYLKNGLTNNFWTLWAGSADSIQVSVESFVLTADDLFKGYIQLSSGSVVAAATVQVHRGPNLKPGVVGDTSADFAIQGSRIIFGPYRVGSYLINGDSLTVIYTH